MFRPNPPRQPHLDLSDQYALMLTIRFLREIKAHRIASAILVNGNEILEERVEELSGILHKVTVPPKELDAFETTYQVGLSPAAIGETPCQLWARR